MKKTIIVLSKVNFDNSPYCNYVHNHAKMLAKMGYNVIVIASISWIPFISKFQKYKRNFMKNVDLKTSYNEIDGVKIIYKKALSVSNLFYTSSINLNGIFCYLSVKKMVEKIIKENNVILIDAHYYKVEGYTAYRLKKKFNVKAFITLHGTSFTRAFNTKNGKKEIVKISKNIDYFICVSEKLQRMLSTMKISNSKVIYNGINFFNEKNKEKDFNSIITVGAFTQIKNIDIVIEAFKMTLNKFPDLKLTIIGSGPLEDKYNELCECIKENVIFTGQLSNEEVYERLSESNVFVLPSSPEGFGIVYVEAMFNKCITIGTKDEGIDGFIKDKENGFLVNINTKEISALIIDILNNKYDLDSIRNNGYIDAKKLTWDINAKKYIELTEDKNE